MAGLAPHLARRLAGSAFVLLAVSFITFVALTAAPGDAAQAMVGDSASAEQIEVLRQSLGLDLPLFTRYEHFLENLVLRGDLGRSLVSGRPVIDLILERLPYTVALALTAGLAATIAGVLIGTAAALRQGTLLDVGIMGGTALGLALPSFWVALLLIMVFSLKLRLLPVVGAGSIRHIVLPALTLALPTAAVVARLTRSSLLDTLGADYVRTARGKGLPQRHVIGVHAMRNSLIPLLAVLGLQLGHLLAGSFVVETIFGWPGLGRLTVMAIFDRDIPVVMGAALVIATIYLLVNLLVDLSHAWLDPRVAGEAI